MENLLNIISLSNNCNKADFAFSLKYNKLSEKQPSPQGGGDCNPHENADPFTNRINFIDRSQAFGPL